MRLNEELENRKEFYETTEKEIDDLGHDKKWIDWIEKYGERLELQTSNENKQKDFLEGILDKITIAGDYDHNRDGKMVQNGHMVVFDFKMKIIEDRYEVIENTKPRKYRVIEGRDTEVSDVMKFISKRNRTQKKEFVSKLSASLLEILLATVAED